MSAWLYMVATPRLEVCAYVAGNGSPLKFFEQHRNMIRGMLKEDPQHPN